MYNILVCDDESGIRLLIKKYAQYEGYNVLEASDGLQAIDMCKNRDIDIVIMDIMMPEMDGFSAARKIREFSSVPIIMLSARGEEYDRIHGFETGADDYVVKPFSPKELMMRVDVILRRGRGRDTVHDVLVKDGLTIDFTARKVLINNEAVDMSPKEYDLLFYMAKNKGVALSRERLITNVWGYDFYGDDRTLDTHIKLLRRHLGDYSSIIVTLRGTGYRFED